MALRTRELVQRDRPQASCVPEMCLSGLHNGVVIDGRADLVVDRSHVYGIKSGQPMSWHAHQALLYGILLGEKTTATVVYPATRTVVKASLREEDSGPKYIERLLLLFMKGDATRRLATNPQKYLILDTESSGLHVCVIQIGYVIIDHSDREVERHEELWRLQDNELWDPNSEVVHGISLQTVMTEGLDPTVQIPILMKKVK